MMANVGSAGTPRAAPRPPSRCRCCSFRHSHSAANDKAARPQSSPPPPTLAAPLSCSSGRSFRSLEDRQHGFVPAASPLLGLPRRGRSSSSCCTVGRGGRLWACYALLAFLSVMLSCLLSARADTLDCEKVTIPVSGKNKTLSMKQLLTSFTNMTTNSFKLDTVQYAYDPSFDLCAGFSGNSKLVYASAKLSFLNTTSLVVTKLHDVNIITDSHVVEAATLVPATAQPTAELAADSSLELTLSQEGMPFLVIPILSDSEKKRKFSFMFTFTCIKNESQSKPPALTFINSTMLIISMSNLLACESIKNLYKDGGDSNNKGDSDSDSKSGGSWFFSTLKVIFLVSLVCFAGYMIVGFFLRRSQGELGVYQIPHYDFFCLCWQKIVAAATSVFESAAALFMRIRSAGSSTGRIGNDGTGGAPGSYSREGYIQL